MRKTLSLPIVFLIILLANKIYGQPKTDIPTWIPELFSNTPHLEVQYGVNSMTDSVFMDLDGQYMIIGNTLWEMSTASEIKHLTDFDWLRFDQSGKYLMGKNHSYDLGVIWDLHNGKPIEAIELIKGDFPKNQARFIPLANSTVFAKDDDDEEEFINRILSGNLIKVYSADKSLSAETNMGGTNFLQSIIQLKKSNQIPVSPEKLSQGTMPKDVQEVMNQFGSITIYDQKKKKKLHTITTRSMISGLYFSHNKEYLVGIGTQFMPNISTPLGYRYCSIWSVKTGEQINQIGSSVGEINANRLVGNSFILNSSAYIDLKEMRNGQLNLDTKGKLKESIKYNPFPLAPSPEELDSLKKVYQQQIQDIDKQLASSNNNHQAKLDSLQKVYSQKLAETHYNFKQAEKQLEKDRDKQIQDLYLPIQEKIMLLAQDIEKEYIKIEETANQKIIEAKAKSLSEKELLKYADSLYQDMGKKVNQLDYEFRKKNQEMQNSIGQSPEFKKIYQGYVDSQQALTQKYESDIANLNEDLRIQKKQIDPNQSLRQKKAYLNGAYQQLLEDTYSPMGGIDFNSILQNADIQIPGVSPKKLQELFDTNNQMGQVLPQKGQVIVHNPKGIYSYTNKGLDYLFTWYKEDWFVWKESWTSFDSTYTLKGHKYPIKSLNVSKDLKAAVTFSSNNQFSSSSPYTYLLSAGLNTDTVEIIIWDLTPLPKESPKILKKYYLDFKRIVSSYQGSGENFLVLGSKNQWGNNRPKEIYNVWEINPQTGEEVSSLMLNDAPAKNFIYDFSSDKLSIRYKDSVVIYHWPSKKRLSKVVFDDKITVMTPFGQNRIFVRTEKNKNYTIELDKPSIKKNITLPLSDISIAFYSYRNKLFVATGYSGQTLFYDPEKMQEIFSIISNENKTKWLIFTPDGYYSQVGRGKISNLKMIINGKGYQFDQFDLIYNRPDKIMQRLPWDNENYLKGAEKAYKKRLERMGQAAPNLDQKIIIPKVKILNSKSLGINVEEKILNLQLEIDYEANDALLLEVYSNNVLLSQQNVSIEKDGKKAIELAVELASGQNKIEVAAANSRGISSLRETIIINYEAPKAESNLYIFSIGVSKYKNGDNLKFAAKDARDFAKLFQSEFKDGNVIADTLTNEEVTKENILKIKKKLLKTSVEDRVIIFLSGHGLIGSDENFYFGAHDIDFNSPSTNGIGFNDISDLLSFIPARKKLLLIDACYSGEREIEDLALSSQDKEALANENISIEKVKTNAKTDQSGIELELMKDLFSDLRRGQGATIITSSSGFQVSKEDNIWKNSAFTVELLNGLISLEADQNQDGKVNVSELFQFLEKSVSKLTYGIQVPELRQENWEADFRVW